MPFVFSRNQPITTVSGIPFCRKSARVNQSQNVPVSCFSQPIGQWLAQAALEGHFGTVLRAHFSSAWNNVQCVSILMHIHIIAKTSRAYTKMSTLMIRLILETLLNTKISVES